MSAAAEGQTVWVMAKVTCEEVNDDGEIRVFLEGSTTVDVPVHFSLVSTDAPVPVGSIPPWMKFVSAENLTHDDGSGWCENVYRIKGEGDS